MTANSIETVVGFVPTSWKIRSLQEISDFITKGGTPTTYGFEWSTEQDGVPFFRSECVTDDGFNPKGMNFISLAAHQQMIRSEVKPGDLLITITGNVGRVAFAPEQYEKANINQHIARIRVQENTEADRSYVYHYLKHEGFATYYRAILTGQAYPQISLQQVRETPIAFPPLPEQRKIATILTAMDDKLDVIARLVVATQKLKQGLMQTLFMRGAGIQDAEGRWVPHTKFRNSELGKIPVGWKVQPLGDLARENRTRNSGSLDDALLCGVLKDEGLVPMRERVKGASTDRCRIVEPNAFAYNPMRINIGSIARNLRDKAVMVSPDYVVFSTRPEELMCSFLDYFRRSDEWQRFVGRSGDGGVRIRIYFDDLAQLRMKVPPLKEQARIVEILDCVDKKLNNLNTMRREFQALKRGLMSKLLTGEWRVKLDSSAEKKVA
jgi:type I restriction enzyme, S subunit